MSLLKSKTAMGIISELCKTDDDFRDREERGLNEIWKSKARHIALLILYNLEIKDIKPESLPKMTGLSTKTVWKILTGEHNFELRTIIKILNVLDLELRIDINDN